MHGLACSMRDVTGDCPDGNTEADHIADDLADMPELGLTSEEDSSEDDQDLIPVPIYQPAHRDWYPFPRLTLEDLIHTELTQQVRGPNPHRVDPAVETYVHIYVTLNDSHINDTVDDSSEYTIISGAFMFRARRATYENLGMNVPVRLNVRLHPACDIINIRTAQITHF
jgi:hypothetical protein